MSSGMGFSTSESSQCLESVVSVLRLRVLVLCCTVKLTEFKATYFKQIIKKINNITIEVEKECGILHQLAKILEASHLRKVILTCFIVFIFKNSL